MWPAMFRPTVVTARYDRSEGAYVLETGKRRPVTYTIMALDQYTSQFDEQAPIRFQSRWVAYQWAVNNGYLPAFLKRRSTQK